MTWHDDRHPAVINTQYIHTTHDFFYYWLYIFILFTLFSLTVQSVIWLSNWVSVSKFKYCNLRSETCVIVKCNKNHNKINDLIYILTQPKRKKNPPIHQKNKKETHEYSILRTTAYIKHQTHKPKTAQAIFTVQYILTHKHRIASPYYIHGTCTNFQTFRVLLIVIAQTSLHFHFTHLVLSYKT